MSKNIAKKYDDYIFRILIRTFKDYKVYHLFKTKREIVDLCYQSRLDYVIKYKYETLFQNITYWATDCVKDQISEDKRTFIRMIFITRLINNLLIEKKIPSRAISKKFFTCFYDSTKNQNYYMMNKLYGNTCFYEIKKALDNVRKHYPNYGFDSGCHKHILYKIASLKK